MTTVIPSTFHSAEDERPVKTQKQPTLGVPITQSVASDLGLDERHPGYMPEPQQGVVTSRSQVSSHHSGDPRADIKNNNGHLFYYIVLSTSPHQTSLGLFLNKHSFL